ncbi:neuropeptide Y receptor type 6-like [Exaiptasia diaphana]|uniref:G-protein coupled receptors family 1 profile domain-containing protein n=1 Tax=Exaiptasia diaphana TaxID=2652724 RepID=A0A913XLS1_EXADI|nr:neuropeptide Y receptor type 6-like [Exaiptasia diaphana]
MALVDNITCNGTSSSVTESTHKLEWKIKLGFNIFISILVFTGNALVLLLLTGKKAKTRTTPFEHFVGNLSVSDIAFEIGYLTVVYVKDRSSLFCKAILPIQSVCLTVSMHTVVAISIFRFQSTTKPLHFKPGRKTVHGTIAGLWGLALVLFIPIYIVLKYKSNYVQIGYVCYEDWPSQTINKAYTVALFIAQYLLPLFAIAFCYVKIVLYLRRHTFPHDSSGNQLQIARKRKQTMEVIRISVAIIILYNITTLPFQIAWLSSIVFQEKSFSEVVFLFSNELATLHSCCNPVVYGVISKRFRVEMKSYISNIFCCCRRKIYSLNKNTRKGDERVELSDLRKPEVFIINNGRNQRYT